MDHLNNPHAQLAGGVTNATGLVIGSSNPLLASEGGTGVNNGSSTFTMGGNVTFSGAFPFTGTLTASTNVTFPTNGTLVNSAVTTLSSLASIGTITTGAWNGSVIGSTYGGTGINNGSSTFTIGGNVAFSGAFPFTGTLTGTTSVTFPTSGTLATLGSNGINVSVVAGTTVTMTDSAVINRYIVTNASLTTLTLPTTVAQGHSFEIIGSGAGGWTIAQNSGQVINFQVNGANQPTTTGTGGSLSSNLSTDCITISNTTANTTFTLSNVYGGKISYV